MKKEKSSKILLVTLVFIVLFISACDTFGDRQQICAENPEACDYYQGTQGVEMRLMNAPSTMYYYSDQLREKEYGGQATFDVQVQNRGASNARGAVFITGFGPSYTIYRMDDGSTVNIGEFYGGCSIGFRGGSGTLSGFSLNCPGIGSFFTDGDSWDFTARADEILREFDIVDLGDYNIRNLIVDGSSKGGEFDIGAIVEGDISMSNFFHGKLHIALLNHIDLFREYGGMMFKLRGDNPTYPGGQQDIKTFEVEMDTDWPAGTDQMRVPYNIKSCYQYSTFASPQVCIDPNPQSGEEKVCNPNTVLNTRTQGGPVAVTNMEQINTGRSVELKFTIENRGSGTVWAPDKLERCSPYYQDRQKQRYHDEVWVGWAELGGRPLECDRYKVNLENGRGQLRCTFDIRDAAQDISSAYTEALRMELWYGYSQSIQRTLNVRRAR